MKSSTSKTGPKARTPKRKGAGGGTCPPCSFLSEARGAKLPLKYVNLHAFRPEQGCNLGCLGVALHLHSTSIYFNLCRTSSLDRVY